MGVLDSIINYKQLEQQNNQFAAKTTQDAIASFIEGRQRSILADFERRKLDTEIQQNRDQLRGTLAVHGLSIDDTGAISRDESLLSPADKIKNAMMIAQFGLDSGALKERQRENDLRAQQIGQEGALQQERIGIDKGNQALSERETALKEQQYADKKAQSGSLIDQIQSGAYRMETFDESGNMTFKRVQTDEEIKKEAQQKAEAQAMIASEKEKQTNATKVSRLGTIADDVEKKFLETSPYNRPTAIETWMTTGMLQPVRGALDVVKSNFQATDAQVKDKAYQSFLSGVRAQLARGMGDVGNLSEYEQKAVIELMPTLMDTKETGLQKLKNLRDYIATIQEKARKKEDTKTSDDGWTDMGNGVKWRKAN